MVATSILLAMGTLICLGTALLLLPAAGESKRQEA